MEERLQKILARTGYGSRRSCEELIIAGRVRVNGLTAELGSKADQSRDVIIVDGQTLPKTEAMVYIALNKPREVLSDVDPKDNRKTVFDLVPVSAHLFAVGRLDYDSEGLMLLTNDGDLAHRLTHPRYEHEKEYRVLVGNRPDEKQLTAWRRGVVMEDGYRTLPAQVMVEDSYGKNVWLRVIMKEGKKRQIREVGARIGLPVLRIVRMRIGTLILGNLKPGEWRNLTRFEVERLRGLSAGGAKPHKSAPAHNRNMKRNPQETDRGNAKRTNIAPRAKREGVSREEGESSWGRESTGARRPSGGRPKAVKTYTSGKAENDSYHRNMGENQSAPQKHSGRTGKPSQQRPSGVNRRPRKNRE